ncbi:MAG: hypothetical protein CR982_04350 [Candidatus Cloacimonadota bacterium]|nr:MAG: hypothetical protein CR982_04350 [Candidatus Cloacimonadota bacterium]PIE78855.1 MAG: hypothetical protein CSA15_05740 [Candidatus Delongbacteria bacterium]
MGNTLGNKKYLGLKEVSELLSISKATINNWVKAGLIKRSEKLFLYDEIIDVKRRIENGEISKLKSRANKISSNNRFIPTGYLSKKSSKKHIETILDRLKEFKLDIESTIFLLSTNLLLKKGEIEITGDRTLKFKRSGVKEVINLWIEDRSFDLDLELLSDLCLPDEVDILGIIYQSLLAEGSKSKMGSYYTPEIFIEDLFGDKIEKESKFLDPCCGTGQFLIKFSDLTNNPLNIFGFDIDYLSVQISRINLLLRFEDFDFYPNIYHLNSLTDIDNGFTNYFDIIATNPPWGAKYSTKLGNILKERYPIIESRESFSYFIVSCERLLVKGGSLGMVLPESITNIKVHADIRKFILDKFSIKSCYKFRKKFKRVLSPVISLRLVKGNSNGVLEIRNSDDTYKVDQSRFSKNSGYVFDITMSNKDREIIDLVDSKGDYYLSKGCRWGLGVVTGNNERFISESEKEDFEPILKGKDLFKFLYKKPSSFIDFKPELLQQIAPLDIYRADEKLIYKFISSSLIFSYDNRKSLALNSGNILIIDNSVYNTKLALAFLNSNLFNFYFKKRFNSFKVLRSDLEKLPFPKLNKELELKIVSMVEKILLGEDLLSELEREIYSIYNLRDDQILRIESV